jgi:hypothetical protein
MIKALALIGVAAAYYAYVSQATHTVMTKIQSMQSSYKTIIEDPLKNR